METVFAAVSVIQVSHSLLSPSAFLPKVRGVCRVLRRGGKNLPPDLRRDIPDMTYSPSLLSRSAADLESDSTPSAHPYGGGKQDWAATSYLNDSTKRHQTAP